MRLWRTPAQVERLEGTIGFVPTMGALHEGHLSLMRKAKSECDTCVISIFVNPTQFGPHEDFQKYPRPIEEDLRLAESVGVDAVFQPDVSDMYDESGVAVLPGKVAELWEGEFRPGHFQGVATIVTKLLHIIRPDISYFGSKDFQQCAVVAAVCEGLNIAGRLSFVDTIREADGLALSSRNRYLSPHERKVAPEIYTSLLKVRDAICHGNEVNGELHAAKYHLSELGIRVQYLAYVDAKTLQPVDRCIPVGRLIFAGYLGTTRLIDNCEVNL